MPKIRITVVKRLNFDEIFSGAEAGCSADMEPVCGLFKDGQEFVSENGEMPAGFCSGAYVDIFRYMSGLRFGANYPWVKEKGKVLTYWGDGTPPLPPEATPEPATLALVLVSSLALLRRRR